MPEFIVGQVHLGERAQVGRQQLGQLAQPVVGQIQAAQVLQVADLQRHRKSGQQEDQDEALVDTNEGDHPAEQSSACRNCMK